MKAIQKELTHNSGCVIFQLASLEVLIGSCDCSSTIILTYRRWLILPGSNEYKNFGDEPGRALWHSESVITS